MRLFQRIICTTFLFILSINAQTALVRSSEQQAPSEHTAPAAQALFDQTLKQTTKIDVTLEELAQGINSGAIKVTDKKIAKEHIITLRSFISQTRAGELFELTPDSLPVLLAINKSLVSHLQTVIPNGMDKPASFNQLLPFTRSKKMRTMSLDALNDHLITCDEQLKALHKSFSQVGATALNRAAQLAQKINDKLYISTIIKRTAPYCGLGVYTLLALHESTLQGTWLEPIKRKLGGFPSRKTITKLVVPADKKGTPVEGVPADQAARSANGILQLDPNQETVSKEVPDVKPGWFGTPIAHVGKLLSIKADPLLVWSPVGFLMPFVIRDVKELSSWADKKTRKAWAGFKGEPFDDGSKVKESKVDFKKVIGAGHVKAELSKVVNYFSKKDTFDRMGIQPDKGYLLVGPLDTGKSLAHALAGEVTLELKKQGKKTICGVYEVHASILLHRDLKEIMDEAEKQAPCVVVLDELDWLSTQTSVDPKIWGTLVNTMNGVLKSARKQVFMVATAQSSSGIDAAVKDLGRLGISMHCDKPTQAERIQFFQQEFDNRCINSADFNSAQLAEQTADCTATQLQQVMKRALANCHAQEEQLQQSHIEQSIDQVVYNIVPQEIYNTVQEKQIMAAHYAGKTIAHLALKPDTTVTRVTISPVAHNQETPQRGALITYSPTHKLIQTVDDVEKDCIIELAGLEAQKLLFDKAVSTELTQQVKQLVFARAKTLVFEGISENALPRTVRDERCSQAWQLVATYTQKAAHLLAQQSNKLHALALKLANANTVSTHQLAQL